MKKIILLSAIVCLSFNLFSQDFQLSFTNTEKFITSNYSLQKIESSLKPHYLNVSKNETEWKFRDDDKSWNAVLYVQFDANTKVVNEIAFYIPFDRVFEFLDELKDKLGYVYLGNSGGMEQYENKNKKLGAKVVYTDATGDKLYYCRLFRK